MQIQLTNPMIAKPQIAYELSVFAKQEQLIRIIEKALFAESIICEDIKVINIK